MRDWWFAEVADYDFGIVDFPMPRLADSGRVMVEPGDEALAVAAAAQLREELAREYGARACGCPPEGLLVRRPPAAPAAPPALGTVPGSEWWLANVEYLREVGRRQFAAAAYRIHHSWWQAHG